jgi:hypothetical protein
MAITKQLTITLTPQELATAFCQMGDDEQAAFFSAIQPERPSMAVAWAMGAVLYLTCAAFVLCLYALFGG